MKAASPPGLTVQEKLSIVKVSKQKNAAQINYYNKFHTLLAVQKSADIARARSASPVRKLRGPVTPKTRKHPVNADEKQSKSSRKGTIKNSARSPIVARVQLWGSPHTPSSVADIENGVIQVIALLWGSLSIRYFKY